MKLNIEPGKYLIAVSGGVDSVALLHALQQKPGVKLTVAHFDHGIRADSKDDRVFVQQLARTYKLPFVYDAAQLGAVASEAMAREARYVFLRKAQQLSNASAIITAHHEDDMLETAIINLLRGTGRKGLSSLTNGEGIIRPLLDIPKTELIDYAKRHGLTWHEDSTNVDTNYLRNHIRHVVLPQWKVSDKRQMLGIVRQMRAVNEEMDSLVADSLPAQLDRKWFILLPHNVAREIMASWLRLQNIHEFDRAGIERLTVAAKVAEPGKAIDIVKRHRLKITKLHLALEQVER